MSNVTNKPFATIKAEFKMLPDDVAFLQSLPDNLPDTKLSKKQIDEVTRIYNKYVLNKVYRGWGQDLAEYEQKCEKWPSGPRVKSHEAKRMILSNLLFLNISRDNMTADEAAQMFFGSLTCRETYTILISKIYDINQ